ncbi:Gfo/Idh/MocA family oxidoreductase [Desulfovibrionales bacterium]
MYSVKIYGAGSIGNHLAHACRDRGWDVLIVDIDPQALERTKVDIYPARYGSWDEKIMLATPDTIQDQKYDLVIVGTPPESHIPIALAELIHRPPRAMLLEKPLCTPSLEGCTELVQLAKRTGTYVSVGYNHVLCRNTALVESLLAQKKIGTPLTIQARVLEHWGDIFRAHPWLDGPKDTYLGYWQRGGGACNEHSHSINIWQHFAHILGMGKVVEVQAMFDMVNDGVVSYDRLCQLHLKTETGFIGSVVQDVITKPTQKYTRILGDHGYIEWWINADDKHDAVIIQPANGKRQEQLIAKTRPDDFKGEIEHMEMILASVEPVISPISLKRGLDTMMVIAAAFASHESGHKAVIDYSKGYISEAIQLTYE